MKKIVVFAMGGTIAMRYDEKTGGLIPAVSGKELVEAVPALKDLCEIEVVEFSREPSSRITPPVMKDLAESIEKRLKDDDVTGVIVTHGTDTLEETAYFLDLYLKSSKPVCVTGAMRSSAEVSPDGSGNMLSSVRVALSANACGMGTLVVMNEEIHAAADVVKTHSSNPKTFISPFWGSLGYADADRIIFKRKPLNRLNMICKNVTANVPLVKLYTGMDNSYFDFLLEKGVDGIVIEAFGRGNMSDIHEGAIKKFIGRGVPVIVATRTFGRPLGLYSYNGGGKSVERLGAILSGEITAAKARLKLILALGITKNMTEIASFFD